MSTFQMKRGDLLPDIEVSLLDSKGKPVNLTTAVSVRLLKRSLATGAVASFAAGFRGPRTGGVVGYSWVAGDTDVAGEFDLEWEILWPGTKRQTYPSRGYDRMQIDEDLG